MLSKKLFLCASIFFIGTQINAEIPKIMLPVFAYHYMRETTMTGRKIAMQASVRIPGALTVGLAAIGTGVALQRNKHNKSLIAAAGSGQLSQVEEAWKQYHTGAYKRWKASNKTLRQMLTESSKKVAYAAEAQDLDKLKDATKVVNFIPQKQLERIK